MNYLPSSRTLAKTQTRLRMLSGALGRGVERLLDAGLPQDCALCGRYSGRWPICATCASALPHLPARHCPRCADTSASGDLCARCLNHAPPFDATFAAFVYQTPLDQLVQTLKYGHQLHLAAWLGHQLADTVTVRALDAWRIHNALVIPMPLHRDRLCERGFNQATEIARPLARRLQSRVSHRLVQRVRHTPAQAHLALADRESNLRGAFTCTADLTGRTVIVVDDVMTSGASVRELSRSLRQNGAQRIIVAVAARTLHD